MLECTLDVSARPRCLSGRPVSHRRATEGDDGGLPALGSKHGRLVVGRTGNISVHDLALSPAKGMQPTLKLGDALPGQHCTFGGGPRSLDPPRSGHGQCSHC